MLYGLRLSDRVFGINIYECLLEYFSSLINDKVNYDIRPLHVFYEHKKCMVLRIEYLFDNKYLPYDEYLYNNYKNLAKDLLIMRNLQLKYFITKEKDHVKKITSKLLTTRKEEKKLIELLIKKLS